MEISKQNVKNAQNKRFISQNQLYLLALYVCTCKESESITKKKTVIVNKNNNTQYMEYREEMLTNI